MHPSRHQQQQIQLQLQQQHAQSIQHMVQQQQQQQVQSQPQPTQLPPHSQQQGMVPQSLAGQMAPTQHVPISSLSQQQQQQQQLKIQALQVKQRWCY